MLKEYASVGIGVLTLLVAAFAAYGVFNVNTEIQAQTPEPINIPDYSDYLNSLDAQIRDIKSDLAVLNELKTDVTEIQQKLSELEEKETVQRIEYPQRIALALDKTTYLAGDTIRITATGIEPQKMINMQILDADDFVLVNKQTWADSTGRVLYQLGLSDAMLPGIYEVRVVSDKDTASEQIRINSAKEPDSIQVDQYTFTVKTNKSLYQAGELIEVTGTGKPNTQVSATLTSPSGNTFTTTSSTQNDGAYTIFFSTSTNFEDGKWYITVTHVAKTIVVSVEID